MTFLFFKSTRSRSNQFCTEEVALIFNTNITSVSLGLACLFLHGLPDVFQALLNTVNYFNCSLWDPGSWTKYGTHSALVQEFIVLRAHRGETQFRIMVLSMDSSQLFFFSIKRGEDVRAIYCKTSFCESGSHLSTLQKLSPST